jgi:hypothetical protein
VDLQSGISVIVRGNGSICRKELRHRDYPERRLLGNHFEPTNFRSWPFSDRFAAPDRSFRSKPPNLTVTFGRCLATGKVDPELPAANFSYRGAPQGSYWTS